jgi:predicted glycogen debranching enzyme
MRDISADELVITIGRGKSREYVYTNKVTAYFSGETGDRPTRSYHGLCASMRKLLEEWRFQLDGVEIDPREAAQVLAFPHRLVRIFENPQVLEHICLLDGLDALVVDLTMGTKGEGALCPRVDIRPVRQMVKPTYGVVWRRKNNLLLVRGSYGGRGTPGGSLWLGLTSDAPLHFSRQERYFPTTYPRGQRRGVMGNGAPYVPGILRFQLYRRKARFLFVAGRTQREVTVIAQRALSSGTALIRRKKRRIERLLSRSYVRTEHSGLNSALAWARISLDALVMDQEGLGIYAGLPWFANYWGRDTGISLPGATWVTGQFALARKILMALADRQDRRTGSRTYGRIPNLIEPRARLYNTADGTLWFVRQIEEFLRYSGDVKAALALFPAIQRALQGEISHRTDHDGLVVHGAAETWMDAGGERRPLTPRDNRAVEIQVLWHTALLTGARLALVAGQLSQSENWTRLAQRVREAFLRKFWDPVGQRLYDHLDPDDTPDEQIRPNCLMALTVPFQALLTPNQERAVLDHILGQLVYPHGVGTLVPEAPQFRPRHLSGRYHFDEAYHNGDVWLWLTGPMVTALVRHGRKETAHLLTEMLTNQLLYKGAVGTLGELFNASPTEENDNEAGTYTQAWSLAEYIRVIFQDYLGIRPNAPEDLVVVEPAVPVAWGDVTFQFAISQGQVNASYAFSGRSQSYLFQAHNLSKPLHLALRARLPGRKLLVVDRELRSGHREEIRIVPHGRGWRALANGKIVHAYLHHTSFDVAQEKKAIFRRPSSLG